MRVLHPHHDDFHVSVFLIPFSLYQFAIDIFSDDRFANFGISLLIIVGTDAMALVEVHASVGIVRQSVLIYLACPDGIAEVCTVGWFGKKIRALRSIFLWCHDSLFYFCVGVGFVKVFIKSSADTAKNQYT